MALDTHEVTKHLYTAYKEISGKFCSSGEVTKDHVVCCSTSKMPLGIYVYVSEFYSMVPKKQSHKLSS